MQIQQEYTTQKATRKAAKLWIRATVVTPEEKRRLGFDQRKIDQLLDSKRRRALYDGLTGGR